MSLCRVVLPACLSAGVAAVRCQRCCQGNGACLASPVPCTATRPLLRALPALSRSCPYGIVGKACEIDALSACRVAPGSPGEGSGSCRARSQHQRIQLLPPAHRVVQPCPCDARACPRAVCCEGGQHPPPTAATQRPAPATGCPTPAPACLMQLPAVSEWPKIASACASARSIIARKAWAVRALSQAAAASRGKGCRQSSRCGSSRPSSLCPVSCLPLTDSCRTGDMRAHVPHPRQAAAPAAGLSIASGSRTGGLLLAAHGPACAPCSASCLRIAVFDQPACPADCKPKSLRSGAAAGEAGLVAWPRAAPAACSVHLSHWGPHLAPLPMLAVQQDS